MQEQADLMEPRAVQGPSQQPSLQVHLPGTGWLGGFSRNNVTVEFYAVLSPSRGTSANGFYDAE